MEFSSGLLMKYFYDQFQRMWLIVSFTVICALFMQPVVAAETVFNSTDDASYTVSYTENEAGRSAINNFFIRELAKYNLTSLYNTSYTFNFKLHRSLHRIEPYTYRVYTTFDVGDCTGNITYRNFDISDILQPELLDFRLVVDHNGNYIMNQDYTRIKLDAEGTFNIELDFDTFVDDSDISVKVEDVTFYSVEQDRGRFYERIGSIDNYYAAMAAMDKSLNKLLQFRDAQDGPIITYIRVSESERIYNRIASSEFIEKLNLSRDYDMGFYTKLDRFRQALDALKYFNERTLKSKRFIKLTTPVSKIVEAYVNEVSDFYYLSQDVTHTYQPYFYNLGMFSYRNADLNKYRKEFYQILKKSGYCNDTNVIAGEIKTRIYNAYVEKAGELIDEQYFYLARGVLDNASHFYTVSTGMVMPVSFNIMMGKVTYTIYNSYLHLIDRAIDVGNFELAENYIAKARDFQVEHSNTIISSKYIHTVSEKLVKLYINKGINQNQKEEYKEAIYCFEQAHSVCSNLGIFDQDYIINRGLQVARKGYYEKLFNTAIQKLAEGNEPAAYAYIGEANEMAGMYDIQHDSTIDFDLIQAKYQQQIYMNDIFAGRKYLQAGNYSMAFNRLLEAVDLEKQYPLITDDRLHELFSNVALPFLIDQCKLGEVKINKNKLDDARQIYENCIALQNGYDLDLGPRLTTSLTKLHNDIFARQCLMVAEQYEVNIKEVGNKVENGDFIAALKVLNTTEALLNENQICEYDQTSLAQMIVKYAPAAEYQTLGREAREALSAGNSDQFIEIYQRMEEMSDMHEIIRKQIEPMPLHYLFSVKKNLALLESSMSGYDSKDDCKTALNILNVLEANNTSVRDSRNIQQVVAAKLAHADKATAMNTDPKERLEKYTGGSAWYRYFRKAYLKNWQE